MNAFSQQSIKVVIPIYHCDQSIVAAATMYRVALLCKEQVPSDLVYHLHWVSIWQWTRIGYQFGNGRALGINLAMDVPMCMTQLHIVNVACNSCVLAVLETVTRKVSATHSLHTCNLMGSETVQHIALKQVSVTALSRCLKKKVKPGTDQHFVM